MTQRQAATSCSISSEVTSASARAGRQDMLCMLPDTAWLQQLLGPVLLTTLPYLQIEFHTCTLQNKTQVLEKPPSHSTSVFPLAPPHC